MCGRKYEIYTDEELEIRYLSGNQRGNFLKGSKPNYNDCPTQLSPIVCLLDGERTIDRFRWGLVPFWATDVKSADKYSLINAKSEEITEKRSYKAPFQKRRCIVPVSGFYEWHRDNSGSKRPFAIRLKKEKIMSLAGIWEHWESKDGKESVNSFAIITTKANSLMEKIHNRMPVILDPKFEEIWLNPDFSDSEVLKDMLKPCPSSWLDAFEVSKMVNSPRNNSKEVLEPVS